MAYSADGTVLATGSRDQAARFWSVATRKLIGGAMRHEGAVARVVFSPDGQRLATATDSGAVRLWDVATTQPLSLVLPHPGVKDVFFTGDGRRLVVAAGNDSIYFHDVPPLPQPAPAVAGRSRGSRGPAAFTTPAKPAAPARRMSRPCAPASS